MRKRESDGVGAARFGQLVSGLSGLRIVLRGKKEVLHYAHSVRHVHKRHAVEHLLDPGALAAAQMPAAGCRRTIAHGTCRECGGVIACRRYAQRCENHEALGACQRPLPSAHVYIYIYEEVDVSLVGNRGQWP